MSSSCQSGGCNITPAVAPTKTLNFEISKENIKEKIETATTKLLILAQNNCWNKVSDNCTYITTELGKHNASDIANKTWIARNRSKKNMPLDEVVAKLTNLYDDLYDVNLYVFHAQKNKTIVEIQYELKSTLDAGYLALVQDTPPTLHSKVRTPPYHSKTSQLFDINWHLGGLQHEWKMFWLKRKLNGKLPTLGTAHFDSAK